MADKSKAWEKLIDDAKKVPEKILGNVTAAIFIFGPSVNGRGKGTKIRKLLKEKIEGHIKERYDNADIIVKFPEDAEPEIQEVTLSTEGYLVRHNITKLIFCVWSEDAKSLIAEITKFMSDSKITVKLRILVDKELWEKKSYVKREMLTQLLHVFNNVFIFDFNDENSIVQWALDIVDAHIRWTKEYGGTWPYDFDELD